MWWEAAAETSRGMVSQRTISKQILLAIGRIVLFNPLMLEEYENRPREVSRFPQCPQTVSPVAAGDWPSTVAQTSCCSNPVRHFCVVLNKAPLLSIPFLQEKPLYCATLRM